MVVLCPFVCHRFMMFLTNQNVDEIIVNRRVGFKATALGP
jgi:hypothetical protein